MTFVWGEHSIPEYIGAAAVTCPVCGYTPCHLHLVKRKLTIYFVPTFATGSTYTLTCPHCHKYWEPGAVDGERLHDTLTGTAPKGSTGSGARESASAKEPAPCSSLPAPAVARRTGCVPNAAPRPPAAAAEGLCSR